MLAFEPSEVMTRDAVTNSMPSEAQEQRVAEYSYSSVETFAYHPSTWPACT